jgi:signal-transduction protein with cAMP-binding, CBS, and nucleotidyltransferase domain
MKSAQTLSDIGRDTTVAEIMKPALMTVEREAHLAAAAFLMHRQERSALVVVADGQVNGVLYIGDACRALLARLD